MPPESTGPQDLRTSLKVLWRWKLLFLAFVVLIPLGVYLYERSKPKEYQSSTLVEVTASSLNAGTFNVPLVNNTLLAVARLVTTTPVANTAAAFLHPPPASPGSLLGQVSVTADTNTGFLTITGQDHDPNRAAAIANAFAAALGNHQTVQANQDLDQQIRAVIKELAVIPRTDQAARAPLAQQLAQLKALRGATGAGAQVIEPASASATPSGPKTRRAVELALVIALLLGFGAVLAAESGDRRLRTPADLEALTNWPLLSVISRGAFSSDRIATPPDDEAFQMLRGALTYFNVDKPLASVAVISPLVGDGKTTVAVGLAVATARAGQRTILVDADLRHPQVGPRLGLAPGAGLGAVLAGERALADVLVEHPIDTPGSGRLLVLPAGPPPPNPAALISSQQMRALVHELESQADLVIIDTAAALAVSDSLPLVQLTSGVVMIVRMNRSSRAAVRRLQKVIVSAGGTVMGVVATGSGSLHGAYDGYYTQTGNGRGSRLLGGLRKRPGTAAPPPSASPAHLAVTIPPTAPPARVPLEATPTRPEAPTSNGARAPEQRLAPNPPTMPGAIASALRKSLRRRLSGRR
jgi:capsular exopolysaccharide synthesis family protein